MSWKVKLEEFVRKYPFAPMGLFLVLVGGAVVASLVLDGC